MGERDMVWPVARPAEEAGFFAWRPLRGRPRRTALPSFSGGAGIKVDGRPRPRPRARSKETYPSKQSGGAGLRDAGKTSTAAPKGASAGAFAGPAPERPLVLADAASSGHSDPRRLGCEVGV